MCWTAQRKKLQLSFPTRRHRTSETNGEKGWTDAPICVPRPNLQQTALTMKRWEQAFIGWCESIHPSANAIFSVLAFQAHCTKMCLSQDMFLREVCLWWRSLCWTMKCVNIHLDPAIASRFIAFNQAATISITLVSDFNAHSPPLELSWDEQRWIKNWGSLAKQSACLFKHIPEHTFQRSLDV